MKSNLKQLIGNRIRELREIKGLSQRDLSRQVGTSNAMISNIENGIANSTVGTLEKLANALEMNVAELLQFDEHKMNRSDVLQMLHNKIENLELPQTALKLFDYAEQLGIVFERPEDYYYVWVMIEALYKKHQT